MCDIVLAQRKPMLIISKMGPSAAPQPSLGHMACRFATATSKSSW